MSALQLGDKNKAIVSFFTLMRTAKDDLEDYLLTLVMHQQAYLQIIELLIICMKEYSVS